MRTQQRRFVPIVLGVSICCAAGCDDTASKGVTAQPAASTTGDPGPSFDFFKDGQPLDPLHQRDLSAEAEKIDDSQVLSVLQLQQVASGHSRGENIQPELLLDLPKIAGAANKKFRCATQWRDLNLCSETGAILHSWRHIAGYAMALREAGAGVALTDDQLCEDAASTLLQLGFVLFHAPSDEQTNRSRILAWGSCWCAAFSLRTRAAEIRGDDDSAAADRRRQDEVITAQKFLLTQK